MLGISKKKLEWSKISEVTDNFEKAEIRAN